MRNTLLSLLLIISSPAIAQELLRPLSNPLMGESIILSDSPLLGAQPLMGAEPLIGAMPIIPRTEIVTVAVMISLSTSFELPSIETIQYVESTIQYVESYRYLDLPPLSQNPPTITISYYPPLIPDPAPPLPPIFPPVYIINRVSPN